MSAAAPRRPIEVVLMRSARANEVEERRLSLEGADLTVADALQAAHWPHEPSGLDAQGLALAIWGRRAALNQPLRDGDRIELLRELAVDPKHARRERFKGQGSRAPGLFSRRRAEAKPGY